MTNLAGRYELERRLGGGGMAEVFLGRLVGRDGFSRAVAIKRVLAHLATDDAFAKMFVAEAQICAKLQHPNIVSVLDFDRDAEGRPFLVIELVDGPSLAELADGGAVPVDVALHVATELLRGLAYAHDLPGGEGVRGLVHRDISPHNVLLSWEGAVKLSDFGIAKARDASGVTASELLKGKPAYMSPEQANGEALDGRSDLFAVGIVLWELLVGRALFAGHTTQETLARVLFAPIPTPRSVRPEIPEDVDRAVMRLLARERADRFADAGAATAALVACAGFPRDGREKLVALLADRFAANAPQRARMLGDVPTVRTPLESAPTLPAPRDAAPSRRRPIVLALAGVSIASTAVAITLFATRPNTTRAQAKLTTVSPDAEPVDAGAILSVDAQVASSEIVDGRDDALAPDAVQDRHTVTKKPSGNAPTEADRLAARAAFLQQMKVNGRGAVLFPPPDERSVDPFQYLGSAQTEVTRLFGQPGKLMSFHAAGLGGDGRLDATIPSHGVAFGLRVPPSSDGFHCVEVSSNAKDDGRFKMLLVQSAEYCSTLERNAGNPRCGGTELFQRAVELGYPEGSRTLRIELRNGRWMLDVPMAEEPRFLQWVENDCH